ncbi:M24 family metallopeptidase [Limnoglobus roseus]|uniref:Aminopeptidase P family protein n=1 Tax=Limnoglobus roseus TaxID=2598579 RepID=A0A5C1AGX3_9BACT|nr:Xaa-Pro peptidase family protein [Limnoglobus roseus]QEL17885.1 aminopeptidase P family protein [Limnoglobus roseus]
MLTAEGCAARRQRLLERLQPTGPLLLGDPLHLRYFANLYVDPFSLGADYGALLLLKPDGEASLFYDARLPKSVDAVHVTSKTAVKWYDGVSPGQGPRRMILRPAVDAAGTGGRIHDSIADAMAPQLFGLIGEMRRAKDDDEVALISACCRAGEAGMAWARQNVKPGMTELDVYEGVFKACSDHAKQPVIVYGDFAVSPGSAKRGGAPTQKVIQPGETLILDFSVVISGYRSDYTNTLVVGAEPTADQQRLFDLCVLAMKAGERHLRAGVHGKDVYEAVRTVFKDAGVADAFPHHAGHGIGLAHPEAPFLVKQSLESLVAGDVVTLEPGLYVDGVGGIRVEHNYLVTETSFEQLSQHELTLK